MASHPTGLALLLSQLGSVATEEFATAIAPLGLTPPLAGVLRLIATTPGVSQRELALTMGAAPSRIVVHLDELEALDVIVREKSDDRRVNRVRLTEQGTALMARLRGAVARADATLADGLDADTRDALIAALRTVADRRGVAPEVHPGMRVVRGRRS
ncbi:MarR family transcriptional regulator [uncultured Williamsia sp.]|uniref:MarR family winged helix-turn-helix transcriptional regulator n=1 Tax=uncultured Williamsia sp. TaxID=259311 RepID=UPI0026343349|nr:MarR family transcriptional regulator [uncultured Williamsia sp.]